MTTPDVAGLLEGEPAHDQVVFATRLQRYWPDLLAGLAGAYPDHAVEMAERAAEIAARNFRQRPEDLRLLDLRRHADPQWHQHPRMLGYAAYTDMFAGDLNGVRDKIDYLAELGVTYLHLMPLLKPRPGANDGGYAVMDYRAVREDLGTVDDLRDLATDLRRSGISLTVDLVLNHVATEHAWARRGGLGRPRLPRLLLHVRRPRHPGRVRAHPAGGLPGLRAGQLHLRRRVAVVGLDHLQHLAVGPQLAQPGGLLRVRRHHLLAGEPRASSAYGWTPSPSSSSGSAPTARTSRRCTRSPRRCGPSPGSRLRR